MDRRPGGAGGIRRLPVQGVRRRAGADVRDPAGPVQQLLQRRSGAAGGGSVHHRRADRHDGDAAAVLDHHDRHRHRRTCGDCGEQQHRSDRHLSGVRPANAADRGDHPHRRGAHPPGAADHHHHDGRPDANDVRRQPGLHRRRLLDRQPHCALVETAGNRGGFRPGHRYRADAGRHPLAVGDPGMVLHLHACLGPGAVADHPWPLQPHRAGLAAVQKGAPAADDGNPVGRKRAL
mmetsp:Transcript_3755/g.4887  ORF Transcript_3755/g.4887 Transcript_3755/m.4887 type:complete len:234 (+) Transcript_3755:1330-2031(+)